MQAKGVSSEAFRVSVSSAPSSSSQGSGQDDSDALGDLYVWGEGIWDGFLGGGTEKGVSAPAANTDALLPKPLESAFFLDVHHIACGSRHAALVTRQGEVFTWGEESGGRLGHGVASDVWQPRLVEGLANNSVDFVACGEYHTCAVTMTGELFTWGDGSHNVGLLGHGNDVSHWIPKKVSGPLDGIHVSSVTCGPWHTALVTSTGQLFTFGDGTFGILGHGDRRSVSYPREVESLKDLRTVGVACGVWHTAAVVEVIVGHSSASSSGKLFTWGDGDKGRLGHGDRETKLVPTCVPALIDYNFKQLACGHILTVGLTTSGQVFTMGSTVYGQLGNPQSDGKLPCLVEGKLADETVEDISCGAYHVAALTSKNEVYTWGKGANGRLGHGDVEDRKTPTLVEALKDKHVKNIACGSNFTAAICLHKWVSGADQSVCSGCRQSFGFTRKRHNCYNCGLVHCHSCSSRKAMKAALAPNQNKLHRVCDSCYVKLKKASELAIVSYNNKRSMPRRHLNDARDRPQKPEKKGLKTQLLPVEVKSQGNKRGKKLESSSQALPLLQLKDITLLNLLDSQQILSKTLISIPQSKNNSRSVSPFARRSSPPRSATPTPTMGGLASSKGLVEDLKKTNGVLSEEVLKLREQVDILRRRCRQQESELERAAKKVQEAIFLAGAESRAKILTSRPRILGASLEQELLPKMTLFKNVLQSKDLLIKVLVRNPSILTYNMEKTLKPSLSFWEGFGFRGKELAKFISAKPDVLRYSSLTPGQMDLIHNIGIDKTSTMYKYILITVATHRTETLQAKMHNLQLCGLSSEEIWELFRVFPKVFALSEEKVWQNMDFIVNDMELPANCVVKYPQLLIANLERVLKPRFLVWQRMKSMNVLGHLEFKSLDSVMIMPEAKFFSKIIKGRPMLYSIYEEVMADVSRGTEISSDV